MFYDVPPQNIGIHNVTGAKKAITKLFYIVLEDDPVSTNVVTSVVTATIEPVTSTSALDPASDSATLTDTVMPIPGTPAPSSSSTASLPASSNSSAYSHFPWPIGLCRGCKAGLALAVLAGVVWCSSLAWYLTPGKEDVDDEDPPPYEEATHIEMATSLDVLIFFVLGGGFLCVVRLALARSRPRPTIYAVQQLCRSTTAVSNWTHDVERKQKQKCSRPIQAC